MGFPVDSYCRDCRQKVLLTHKPFGCVTVAAVVFLLLLLMLMLLLLDVDVCDVGEMLTRAPAAAMARVGWIGWR